MVSTQQAIPEGSK